MPTVRSFGPLVGCAFLLAACASPAVKPKAASRETLTRKYDAEARAYLDGYRAKQAAAPVCTVKRETPAPAVVGPAEPMPVVPPSPTELPVGDTTPLRPREVDALIVRAKAGPIRGAALAASGAVLRAVDAKPGEIVLSAYKSLGNMDDDPALEWFVEVSLGEPTDGTAVGTPSCDDGSLSHERSARLWLDPRPDGSLQPIGFLEDGNPCVPGVGSSSSVWLEAVHAANIQDVVIFDTTERSGSESLSYRSVKIVTVRGGKALEILSLRSETFAHRDEAGERHLGGDWPLQMPTFSGAFPKRVVPGEGHDALVFDPALFVYK